MPGFRRGPFFGARLAVESRKFWHVRGGLGTVDAGDAPGAVRVFRRSRRFPNQTTLKDSAAAHPSAAPASPSKFAIHDRFEAFRGLRTPGTRRERRGFSVVPICFRIGRTDYSQSSGHVGVCSWLFLFRHESQLEQKCPFSH